MLRPPFSRNIHARLALSVLSSSSLVFFPSAVAALASHTSPPSTWENCILFTLCRGRSSAKSTSGSSRWKGLRGFRSKRLGLEWFLHSWNKSLLTLFWVFLPVLIIFPRIVIEQAKYMVLKTPFDVIGGVRLALQLYWHKIWGWDGTRELDLCTLCAALQVQVLLQNKMKEHGMGCLGTFLDEWFAMPIINCVSRAANYTDPRQWDAICLNSSTFHLHSSASWAKGVRYFGLLPTWGTLYFPRRSVASRLIGKQMTKYRRRYFYCMSRQTLHRPLSRAFQHSWAALSHSQEILSYDPPEQRKCCKICRAIRPQPA